MCQTCRVIEVFQKTDNEYKLYSIIRRECFKEGKMNGSIMSNVLQLNFCPECGRKLKIKTNLDKWKEEKKGKIEEMDAEDAARIEDSELGECTWCKEYKEDEHYCCNFLTNRGEKRCKEYIKQFLSEEA